MDKEVKERWLTALKSGDYKKGVKTLRTSRGEFCCLGVLADLDDHLNEDGDLKNDRYYMGGVSPFFKSEYDISLLAVEELVVLNDKNETWDLVIDYIEKKL